MDIDLAHADQAFDEPAQPILFQIEPARDTGRRSSVHGPLLGQAAPTIAKFGRGRGHPRSRPVGYAYAARRTPVRVRSGKRATDAGSARWPISRRPATGCRGSISRYAGR